MHFFRLPWQIFLDTGCEHKYEPRLLSSSSSTNADVAQDHTHIKVGTGQVAAHPMGMDTHSLQVRRSTTLNLAYLSPEVSVYISTWSSWDVNLFRKWPWHTNGNMADSVMYTP